MVVWRANEKMASMRAIKSYWWGTHFQKSWSWKDWPSHRIWVEGGRADPDLNPEMSTWLFCNWFFSSWSRSWDSGWKIILGQPLWRASIVITGTFCKPWKHKRLRDPQVHSSAIHSGFSCMMEIFFRKQTWFSPLNSFSLMKFHLKMENPLCSRPGILRSLGSRVWW